MKKNRFSKAFRKRKAEQEKFETKQKEILKEDFIKNLNLLHSYIESNYELIQEFIDFLKGIDKNKVVCKIDFYDVADFNLDNWLDTSIEKAIIDFDKYPLGATTPYGHTVFHFGVYVNPNPRYGISIKFGNLKGEPKLKKPFIEIERAYFWVGKGNKFSYPWADTELELEQALDIIVKEITPAIAD